MPMPEYTPTYLPVEQDILDAMVSHGHAICVGDHYQLTEAGELWIKDFCARELQKLGAVIQSPLEGMDGDHICVGPDGNEVRITGNFQFLDEFS